MVPLDSNALWRGVGGTGGADYGINASGAGGWNSVRHGVRIGSPNSASLFPDAYPHVTLSDNVMRGAFRAGLFVDLTRVDVTLKNNTID